MLGLDFENGNELALSASSGLFLRRPYCLHRLQSEMLAEIGPAESKDCLDLPAVPWQPARRKPLLLADRRQLRPPQVDVEADIVVTNLFLIRRATADANEQVNNKRLPRSGGTVPPSCLHASHAKRRTGGGYSCLCGQSWATQRRRLDVAR